jgi:hypothetical protein
MRKLSKIVNNNLQTDFDFSLLHENEMFNIRGGAEDKPKSRPREILDWELQSQTKVSVQSTEEPSLFDYLKQWLQYRKQ